MTPIGSGGVCYRGGITVKENHQMCEVTSMYKPPGLADRSANIAFSDQKIVEQLGDKKPQVTFSCKAASKTCGFQCE